MQKKMYQWFVVISFFLLLTGFALAEICMPDKEISKSERRYYEQLPEWSWTSVMDGSYVQSMEKYLLDEISSPQAYQS